MICRTALDVLAFLETLEPNAECIRVYATVLAPGILHVRWCWRSAAVVVDVPPGGAQAAILGVN